MSSPAAERLLTIAQAAELLATSERFPRRLIEERRIRFVRVGRFVRIPESALREFIQAGQVEPVTTRKGRVAWCPTTRDAAAGSAPCEPCPPGNGRPATGAPMA